MIPDDYVAVISDQMAANVHFGMIEDMKMKYAATLDEALEMAHALGKKSVTVIPNGIADIVGKVAAVVVEITRTVILVLVDRLLAYLENLTVHFVYVFDC